MSAQRFTIVTATGIIWLFVFAIGLSEFGGVQKMAERGVAPSLGLLGRALLLPWSWIPERWLAWSTGGKYGGALSISIALASLWAFIVALLLTYVFNRKR